MLGGYMKITAPCPHNEKTFVWAKETEIKFVPHDKVMLPLFDEGTFEATVVYVDKEDSNYYMLEVGELSYEQILTGMPFNPSDGTLIAPESPIVYEFIPHFIKDTVHVFEFSVEKWFEKIISKLKNNDKDTELKYKFISPFRLHIINPYLDKDISVLLLDKFVLQFECCECSFDTDDESIAEMVEFINKILSNDIYVAAFYENDILKSKAFVEGDIDWRISAKQLRRVLTDGDDDLDFNYSIYCSAWGKYRSKWFDNPEGDKGFAFVLEEDGNILHVVKGCVPVNYGSGRIKEYSKRKAIIDYMYFNPFCQNLEDMYSRALDYLEKRAEECGYKQILVYHQKRNHKELVDNIDFYKKRGYKKSLKLNRKKLEAIFNHNLKIRKSDSVHKKNI